MTFFSPIESLQFYPESYLPNAAYIPAYFQPIRHTLDGTQVQFEIDSTGQTSIINLETNDGTKITPFIDLSRYDAESKDWLWYDDDGLYYRLTRSNNIDELNSLYPTRYSGIVRENESLIFNRNSIELSSSFAASYNDPEEGIVTGTYSFYKYSPIIVTINNWSLTDISDYSNITSSDRLNRIDPSKPEFYYDFNGRLYTNQNVAGVDPKNVKIHYFTAGQNSITLSCRMSSNAGSASYFTPKVDNYIVKLKGQYLRG